MKLVWIVELGKFLLESMKRGIIGNILAMLIISGMLAWAGWTVVEAKHNEAVEKIEANKKKIETVSETQQKATTTLAVMQETLQRVAENLKEMKDDLKVTRTRVWQIREDQLKRN